jgi:RNA polymerase subunit RPABC4/transcription elongation factor Spt4
VETCKKCQQLKDGHRHCSDCGAKIITGIPTIHNPSCYKMRVNLKVGQQCSICHRLLAAGADCPTHGRPWEVTP